MTLSGTKYLCAAGETFDIVALTIWGDEKYASELLCANPDKCLTTTFSGGELLEIPEVDVPDTDDGYMPSTAPWKEG